MIVIYHNWDHVLLFHVIFKSSDYFFVDTDLKQKVSEIRTRPGLGSFTLQKTEMTVKKVPGQGLTTLHIFMQQNILEVTGYVCFRQKFLIPLNLAGTKTLV